jgi:glutathione S-transferase
MAVESLPVLWQLELSHYNEKVRWALDYKRIPHIRRALLVGIHAVATRRLTGSVDTTPVLTLDGRSIGDSTKILAAIEERWATPPLYPADPQERRRALELEDYFDEELGPHVRRAVYFILLQHPKVVYPLFAHGQRLLARVLLWAAFPIVSLVIRQRLSVNEAEAVHSREKIVAAMDRLERELGPSGYLVGDQFSVADLTAASLFYPIVLPPEFPYPQVHEVPEEAREYLAELTQRPGGQWVLEMYARHRAAPRAVAA